MAEGRRSKCTDNIVGCKTGRWTVQTPPLSGPPFPEPFCHGQLSLEGGVPRSGVEGVLVAFVLSVFSHRPIRLQLPVLESFLPATVGFPKWPRAFR